MDLVYNPLLLSFFPFLVAFATTMASVPQVLKIGQKYDFKDNPSPRKQHANPLVRIGGVAIFLGFLAAASFVVFASNFFDFEYKTYLSFILGGLLFFLIGFADDIYSLSPWVRLFLQVVSASILWVNGLNIQSLRLPFINIPFIEGTLPTELSFLITIIWIVGLVNAINWMDGLDGLASGISFISSLGILILGIHFNLIYISLIAASVAGACSAFLVFNFYPAKILMGDGGSYLLGYSLAILTILGTDEIPNKLNFFPAILVLLIPIFDMSAVIFSRMKSGKSPFFPDRSHLHHRILDLGYSERNTVILIYSFSTLFITLSFNIVGIKYYPVYISVSCIFLFLTIYASQRRRNHHRK